MNLRLEHLPADVVGLPAVARVALRDGEVNGIGVARRVADVPRPEDRHDLGERGVLARALAAGLVPLDPPARVQTSLNVLEKPGSFAVVTGQQPGFLGSPLYTLYKALQACRLAQELSGVWGVPIVPVFWNHADDHDVAEVHHSYQVNRNLDLQKVGLAGMSSGRLPISRIELSDATHRLGATRSLLAQLYEEREHTERALEIFFPREGETLARALSRALTTLLGDHGLVVVEPDWIRADLTHHAARLVGLDPVPLVERATEGLSAAGLAASIDPGTAAWVYRVDESGRRPLRPGGEGFRYDGEPGSRTAQELAAEMVEDPEGWSPAALLRPVAQDAVFPVCAYVGGWGELGYHAQLAELRDAAHVLRTPFVPRVSATVVEPEVRVALEKTDSSLRDVLAARGEFEVAGGEPPAVIQEIRASIARAADELLAHRAALADVEPALGQNLKRAADQVKSLVEKVLGKAERVHANTSGKGRRQVRRLNNSLQPRGEQQERVLGPLGFTARWGPEWIEAVYEELPAVSSEHIALHLHAEEEA